MREVVYPQAGLKKPSFYKYLLLTRPDHWFKQIFMLPGVALALLLVPHGSLFHILIAVGAGIISTCCIASANYVINEWLDAEFDAHHPVKHKRPAATYQLSSAVVQGEYAVLVLLGLVIALKISYLFFGVAILFLLSGLTYNVQPFRTKDKAYLDVLFEAINNPIRLLLGWAAVSSFSLPPVSLLFTYWMGGAFLMALKRFAEYRFVMKSAGMESLVAYRKSFKQYTDNSLLISAFLYALLAAFFLGIFLVKYRAEYLLTLPLFAILFTSYLRASLKPASKVQTPEKLYKEKSIVLISVVIVFVLAATTVIDIPFIRNLVTSPIIRLN